MNGLAARSATLIGVLVGAVGARIAHGAEPIAVPLTKSSEITTSVEPGYPRQAQFDRVGAVVAVRARINAGGGLEDFEIEPGQPEAFAESVEEALLRTRFSAPVPVSGWQEHSNAHGCAAWLQSVKIEYRFWMEGDWARVSVVPEFSAVGEMSAESATAMDEWMDSHGFENESKTPGFVHVKPILRIPPKFPKRAARELYTAPAFVPQVVSTAMLINTKGRVTEAFASGERDDPYGFKREARKAAVRWEFEPARRDGVPVPQVACQRFNFQVH